MRIKKLDCNDNMIMLLIVALFVAVFDVFEQAQKIGQKKQKKRENV